MTTSESADIRQRRELLGLSREKLARQANCAAITIEMLEGGWRPKRSRVLPALLATLDRLERGLPQTDEAPATSRDLVKLGDGAADRGTV